MVNGLMVGSDDSDGGANGVVAEEEDEVPDEEDAGEGVDCEERLFASGLNLDVIDGCSLR